MVFAQRELQLITNKSAIKIYKTISLFTLGNLLYANAIILRIAIVQRILRFTV